MNSAETSGVNNIAESRKQFVYPFGRDLYVFTTPSKGGINPWYIESQNERKKSAAWVEQCEIPEFKFEDAIGGSLKQTSAYDLTYRHIPRLFTMVKRDRYTAHYPEYFMRFICAEFLRESPKWNAASMTFEEYFARKYILSHHRFGFRKNALAEIMTGIRHYNDFLQLFEEVEIDISQSPVEDFKMSYLNVDTIPEEVKTIVNFFSNHLSYVDCQAILRKILQNEDDYVEFLRRTYKNDYRSLYDIEMRFKHQYCDITGVQVKWALKELQTLILKKKEYHDKFDELNKFDREIEIQKIVEAKDNERAERLKKYQEDMKEKAEKLKQTIFEYEQENRQHFFEEKPDEEDSVSDDEK